jgi:prevent-host-death family protein
MVVRVKTVAALEVRKRFGQILDEAAAGEQIVIERAGRPVAALIPLSDFHEVSADTRRQRRLEAIDDIRRLARQHPIKIDDPEGLIRQMREERTQQILRAAGLKDMGPR